MCFRIGAATYFWKEIGCSIPEEWQDLVFAVDRLRITGWWAKLRQRQPFTGFMVIYYVCGSSTMFFSIKFPKWLRVKKFKKIEKKCRNLKNCIASVSCLRFDFKLDWNPRVTGRPRVRKFLPTSRRCVSYRIIQILSSAFLPWVVWYISFQYNWILHICV